MKDISNLSYAELAKEYRELYLKCECLSLTNLNLRKRLRELDPQADKVSSVKIAVESPEVSNNTTDPEFLADLHAEQTEQF